MTEKTSSSLLRRLRNPGDQDSWGEFVSLYEPLLVRYVRKKGLNDHDAQDVVQSIFIALLRKLPTFELDRSRGRFRTWLWQVTHNAVVDWARSNQRARAMQDQLQAGWKEGGDQPDAEWDRELQQRILEFAAQKVREQTSPQNWACFEKYLVAGRSGADVAAELNLPVNTVYVYAARVMSKVKEKCQEYLEEQTDE